MNYRSILLIIITLIILIMFNIISVLKINKSKNDLSKTVEKLKESNEMLISLSKILRIRDSLAFIIEDLRLNENTIVTTLNNDSIHFYQILDENPKLVFRFTEESCPPCVEMEIERLKKIGETIGKENVVVLTSYRNLRYLKLLKQQNNIDFSIYNINDTHLNFPTVLENIPFLFIINSKLEAELVFIPEKTIPELSLQYYKIVKKRFFE